MLARKKAIAVPVLIKSWLASKNSGVLFAVRYLRRFRDFFFTMFHEDLCLHEALIIGSQGNIIISY